MLAGLATWVILGHSERRARLRRDRRADRQEAGPGRRRRPAADPVRRRASSPSARPAGRPRSWAASSRAPSRAATPTRSVAAGDRHRLRARVGHRHRPERVRRRRRGDGRRDPGDACRSLGWGDGADATSGPLRRQRHHGQHRRVPRRARVDGALVGGASLKPDEMAGIVARAGITAQARGRRPRDAEGDAARAPSSSSSSTGSASGPTRPWTPSPPRRCRAGARLLAALAPLRPARHPRTPSACPRARWATPRSATSTSAPAARSSRTCPGSTPPSPTAVLRRARPSSPPASGRRTTGRLHLVGLIGPGGVHAHDRHLVALVELAARLGVPRVRVHALLDGRDTPPRSALGFVRGPRGAAWRPSTRTRGSPRSAAATTPWTATSAGSAPSAATTPSSTA